MKRWLSAVLAAALALAVLAAPPALATGLAFSSTPLAGSSGNKIHNVTRAAAAIDGTTLYEGDIFSFNDFVGARTAAGGYRSANNGRGAMVVGGGVAQAATTLYLALTQLGDVEYLDLHTYGAKFADNYVDSGYDAILTDDEVGIDFSFVSLYPGSLTISMWVTDDDVNCLVSLSDDIGDPGDGGMVGSSSTPLYGTDAKIDNVLRAAQALSDVTLQPYDLFSFNDLVGPRTAANGYRKAVNGRGAMVVGGGVAQAA
ncbi:MAG: VanW family protein, partial [Clostridiales bacterium]|nr:VanW family protein [Clostridiales bacterium]